VLAVRLMHLERESTTPSGDPLTSFSFFTVRFLDRCAGFAKSSRRINGWPEIKVQRMPTQEPECLSLKLMRMSGQPVLVEVYKWEVGDSVGIYMRC
jgi:hypothetical protein